MSDKTLTLHRKEVYAAAAEIQNKNGFYEGAAKLDTAILFKLLGC